MTPDLLRQQARELRAEADRLELEADQADGRVLTMTCFLQPFDTEDVVSERVEAKVRIRLEPGAFTLDLLEPVTLRRFDGPEVGGHRVFVAFAHAGVTWYLGFPCTVTAGGTLSLTPER